MSVTLSNGNKMPLVGFGLWKVNKDTCANTVYDAIKAGVRLFDGACDYGNEVEAGQGIRRAIDEGLVKREDLFITTKLWNTFHAREHVLPAAHKQLKDWGLDYFDLYMMHFPISLKYVDFSTRYPPEWWKDEDKNEIELGNASIYETWHEIEKFHEQGFAKSIGISNCAGGLITDIFSFAKVKPAVLQIEHHPLLTQPELLKFCKTLDLAVTAYSSYGPMSFIELGADKGIKPLFEEDIITSIASKHGKSPAQVLLRWSTQRGIAVIPKSNKVERIRENLACTDFDLSEEEINKINSLNRGIRFNNPAELDPRLAIFA